MKNACFVCKPGMRNLGLFLLRVTVAVIFIYAGWTKLANMEQTIIAFTDMGFPAATFVAYLVGIVELVGGLAVLLGVYTKVAATLLAIIMIVAIFTAHWSDLSTAQLPFVLLGANLGLMGTGAGSWRLTKDCCCGCE